MLHTSSVEATCSVCRRAFIPRHGFQREAVDDDVRYFCSLPCRANPLGDPHVTCGVCGTPFVLTLASQAVQLKDENGEASLVHVCGDACRARAMVRRPVVVPPLRIAVLNQKGGTGKTTTSVNLAAGIAERGARVLLIDADPQGNVGISLGLTSSKTLYHVLIEDAPLADVATPIGKTFDVVTSDENLAAAEIKLATRPGQGGLLKKKLDQVASTYTHVIIDCGPSISLLNQNALCAVDEVLIPVACDYLSLVGVKQVLKTIKNVSQHLGHPVVVGGVLPTFYDTRARVCRDAWHALQKHFGDLCLPPIRYNARLKEAPSHKKTIFEHDASSHGAEDYRKIVDWLASRRAITSTTAPEAREVRA